ncbi:hypothetical protein ACFQJ7_10195 [Halovenus rubra]|uniref:Flagellin n=2 Tax=Halovenus rubra TaxID=869890 RepID=A0ABD5XB12_9EURY|nr:hypothetical protein [Halovenus rubra]
MRAQTELVALGIAFVLLTGTVVAGVVLADGSVASAERESLERQTAVTLSERLVDERAKQTHRENVLSAKAVAMLNETILYETYNIPDDSDVAISLGQKPIIQTGNTEKGTTIERIVLVERRTVETLRPTFNRRQAVTLPRRASNATLHIDPPLETTVEHVTANGHVLLSNSSGLKGTFDVTLSSYQTTTFRFEATGVLDAGSVEITYAPPATTKATLRVSVDA